MCVSLCMHSPSPNSALTRDSGSLSSFLPFLTVTLCSRRKVILPVRLRSAVGITQKWTPDKGGHSCKSLLQSGWYVGVKINPLFNPKSFKVISELSFHWKKLARIRAEFDILQKVWLHPTLSSRASRLWSVISGRYYILHVYMKITWWILKKNLFSISAWVKKLLCCLVVRYGTRINQILVAALSCDFFVYIVCHITLIFMDLSVLYWWEWCKICANGHELNSIFGMLLTIMLHLWNFFRQQSWAAELEISIASAFEY